MVKLKKSRRAQALESGRKRAQNFIVDGSEYELGKVIGHGSFATVYLATHVPTNRTWVIKRLERIRADQENMVESEIDIMQRAGSHSNIVNFHGWFRDADHVMCLVLGYCEGGSLDQLTTHPSASPSYFSEQQIMEWFAQLLLALNHLHKFKILHRDIKPQNIFLSKNQRVVQLGDLGIARQLTSTQDLATTCLGTPFYMSPELMANRPYTFGSDMWALGCVLYEMAARCTAFEAQALPQLVVKVMRNAYKPLPSHFSRPLQQLVGMILRADPRDRPTAANLLSLPIVKSALQSIASKSHPLSQIRMSQVAGGRCSMAFKPRRPSASCSEPAQTPEKAEPGVLHAAAKRSNSEEHPIPPAITKPTSSATPDTTAAAVSRQSKSKKSKARRHRPKPAVVPVKVAVKVQEWDNALSWEVKQAQRAEARYRALEYEKRMARQAAKQWRRERDKEEEANIAAERALLDAVDGTRRAQRHGNARANRRNDHARQGHQRRVPAEPGQESDARAYCSEEAHALAGQEEASELPPPDQFSWGCAAVQSSLAFDLGEVPEGLVLDTMCCTSDSFPEPPGNLAYSVQQIDQDVRANNRGDVTAGGDLADSHDTPVLQQGSKQALAHSCRIKDDGWPWSDLDPAQLRESLPSAFGSAAQDTVTVLRTWHTWQPNAHTPSHTVSVSALAPFNHTCTAPSSDHNQVSKELDHTLLRSAGILAAHSDEKPDGPDALSALSERLEMLVARHDDQGVRALLQAMWFQSLVDGSGDSSTPPQESFSGNSCEGFTSQELQLLRLHPQLLYSVQAKRWTCRQNSTCGAIQEWSLEDRLRLLSSTVPSRFSLQAVRRCMPGSTSAVCLEEREADGVVAHGGCARTGRESPHSTETSGVHGDAPVSTTADAVKMAQFADQACLAQLSPDAFRLDMLGSHDWPLRDGETAAIHQKMGTDVGQTKAWRLQLELQLRDMQQSTGADPTSNGQPLAVQHQEGSANTTSGDESDSEQDNTVCSSCTTENSVSSSDTCYSSDDDEQGTISEAESDTAGTSSEQGSSDLSSAGLQESAYNHPCDSSACNTDALHLKGESGMIDIATHRVPSAAEAMQSIQ